MRLLSILVVLAVGFITTVCQCQKPSEVGSPKEKGVIDPRITAKWPGKPKETFGDPADQTKTYSASLDMRNGRDGLMYRISMVELPDEILKLQPQQNLLDEYLLGSKNNETSRISLRFCPQKFVAIEVERTISHNKKTVYDRQVVFMTENRLYSVSLVADSLQALRGKDAQSFLESVSVTEK
jgi:hypothetical protein